MNSLFAQLRNPALPEIIGGAPGANAGGTALGLLISNLVGGLLVAGFLLALVFLLTGGISWITSGGDKAALEKARNQITHAVIGIIIVAAAWAMATLAGGFLGLDIQHLTLPPIK